AAAIRDQRARIGGHGLRRGRRHRPGPDRGHPQVLLLGHVGHPASHSSYRRGDRRPDLVHPPSPDRPGGRPLMGGPPDVQALRDRYPQQFAQMSRHRVAMAVGAAAGLLLLLFGLAELGFFGGGLLGGGARLLEILGLMLPPDPGSWANARAFALALL